MISIIVAVSEDWGIGKDNELLWHISEDLKRFKRLTTGNTVIMGKKTWVSLPRKPLPGRKNIVLTDDPKEIIAEAVTAYSIEDALSICDKDIHYGRGKCIPTVHADRRQVIHYSCSQKSSGRYLFPGDQHEDMENY
jgi:dihydrofolate reductase